MNSGGKSRVVLLLFAFLAVCFSFFSGFEMTFGTMPGGPKEPDTMFMLESVEYPIKNANVQLNSHLNLTTGARGTLLWSKEYRDANAYMTPAPGTVLIKGDTIGVVSPSNLLFYATDGSFRYGLPIGLNTPVVFGRGAIAYIGRSYLLNYREYSKKLILEGGEFPTLQQWAYVIAFKPGREDFLAVVQFTGGPMREPPMYDVYRKEIEKSRIRAAYTGNGTIRHAMLTNDHSRFVLIQGGRVNVLETVDMKVESHFDLGYTDVQSASLDPAGNVVFIGRGAKNRGERPYLSAVSLDGKLLWEYSLRDPQGQQPPACGGAGQVYVVDAGSLKSISNGRLAWSQPVKGRDKAWLTITKDDAAIMLQTGSLTMFDASGVVKFSVQVAGDGERFDTPPAVDARGRIYVAGDRKLYCFE